MLSSYRSIVLVIDNILEIWLI